MIRRMIDFTFTFLMFTILFLNSLYGQQTYSSYAGIDQDTIFFDDFTSFSNYWLLGIEEGEWTETLEEGKLYFQSHTNVPKEDCIPVFIDTYRDFEIETQIQFLEGDITKAYGLQFGKSKTESRQYDFFLASNGHFTIDKYEDGFIDYVPFTLSEAVNRYAPNKLTVRKVSDSLYYFLNEHLVHSMPFQPFFGNLTGIQVGEYSTILVDYFKVAYLDQETDPVSKILITDYTYQTGAQKINRSSLISLILEIQNAGNKDVLDLELDYILPEKMEVVAFNYPTALRSSEIDTVILRFYPDNQYDHNEIKVNFTIDGADITNANDVDFFVHLDEAPNEVLDRALLQTYAQYRGEDPLKGLNVAQTLRSIEIGDYYALIIGIDNFTGEWAPLRNAVNDARAIEDIIKTKYQFDYVITLYDEEATRSNILQALDYLLNHVKENDNLFIYYSGHGEFNEQMNQGYWVPVDAVEKKIHQYVSNEEIRSFLSAINSRHTLLVTDACFSGDIFRGKTLTIPYENSTKYYHKVYSLMSRKAITSGGVEPVMDGGREGHSIFGYYFMKSLEENDRKYLDGSELFNQIRIPVINNSDQVPQYSPVHKTGDEGGQFVFILKDQAL